MYDLYEYQIGSYKFKYYKGIIPRDKDFSYQYSKEVVEYGKSKGFTYIGVDDIYLADSQFMGVLKKEGVDIILHADEELVRRVWANLTPQEFYDNVYKKGPKLKDLSIGDKRKAIIEYFNKKYDMLNNTVVDIYGNTQSLQEYKERYS